MAVVSSLSVYWISIFLISSGMGVPLARYGYPSSSDDALDQYWSNLGYLIEPRANKMSALAQASSSASMSQQGSSEAAPRGKGVSKVGDWSFASSGGNAQSQAQTGWNMGGDSEMAAVYQQSEGSDMQELPQEVSEPYSPSFIVQTSSGYKRSRLSGTADEYSLNKGLEAYGINPEDF